MFPIPTYCPLLPVIIEFINDILTYKPIQKYFPGITIKIHKRAALQNSVLLEDKILTSVSSPENL